MKHNRAGERPLQSAARELGGGRARLDLAAGPGARISRQRFRGARIRAGVGHPVRARHGRLAAGRCGAEGASPWGCTSTTYGYAARELAKIGRTLVIEPINSRDMPGYFLNTQAEAHAVCAAGGEPNIKVQMDLYHAQIVEGDRRSSYGSTSNASATSRLPVFPNGMNRTMARSTIPICSGCSTNSATTAGWAANTGRGVEPRMA